MSVLAAISPIMICVLLFVVALALFAFIWVRANADFDERLANDKEVVMPARAIATWNAHIRNWAIGLGVFVVAIYVFRDTLFADLLGFGGP